MLLEERVGEPRCVGQQVGDGYRPIGRNGLRIVGRTPDEDLHVGERRYEPGQRVPEAQLPCLGQLHDGNRGDRLGHGVEAPEGVIGHRDAGLPVRESCCCPQGDLSAPCHEHVGTDHEGIVNEASCERRHPVESIRIKAELSWRGDCDPGHGLPLWLCGRGGETIGWVSRRRRSAPRRSAPLRPRRSRCRGWRSRLRSRRHPSHRTNRPARP